MEFKFINGVKIFAPKSKEELLNYSFDHKKNLIAINAEKIMNATSDSKAIINGNIGYPDGIGAVYSLKKKGIKNVSKIPGCELWLDFVNKYYKDKCFYLIGSTETVIHATVSKLKTEFDGISISNFRNGYIENKTEELALIKDIKNLKPDIVFVAIGSPEQERLMERIKESHNAVYMGLGGSFDIYSGMLKRAPKWLIDYNLEWAYRLLIQPSRIKRQIYLIKFFIKLSFNRY